MKKSTNVTIITGFLGSGKTTLINRLLTQDSGRKYAVIVNEFGDLGIDGDLIVGADDRIVELTNGCLCCSVRGDLIEALETLRPKLPKLDGVIIETSGLADPVPVAQTFLVDEDDSKTYQLDGIVTLVDSLHFDQVIAEEQIASNQIAIADRLVLTKTDIVPASKVLELRKRLQKINPHSEIVEAQHGKISESDILNIGAFDASRMEVATTRHHHSDHDFRIQNICLSSNCPLDPDSFAKWVQQLLVTEGEKLLRSKGIIDFAGETRRFVFQGVQSVVEGDVQGPWPDGPRSSSMVLIGRDLNSEQILSGWNSCISVPRNHELNSCMVHEKENSLNNRINEH